MMTKPVQQFGRIFGMRLRAAIAALTMAVVLLASAVLAAQSEHGPSYRYKVLYDFCPLTNCPDGAIPWASLIQDPKGNLYSTASSGGGNPREGTVFKVTATGKETVLYTFTGGTDGGYSTAGLARDSAGNLYGTTQYGGSNSCGLAPAQNVGYPIYQCGTAFWLGRTSNNPGASWAESVIWNFGGGTDGYQPQTGLIKDESEKLYGTTTRGGIYANPLPQNPGGTAFVLVPLYPPTTAWTEQILYNFGGFTGDTEFPSALILEKGIHGDLIGAGFSGGTTGAGTVFEVLNGYGS